MGDIPRPTSSEILVTKDIDSIDLNHDSLNQIYTSISTHKPRPRDHQQSLPLQPPLTPITQPIPKTNRHGNHQPQTQHTRPPLIMIIHRPPILDLINSPQKQAHTVHQRDDGDDGEGPCRGQGDPVAEVEEGGGY